jgi:hypothetical protein
MKKYIIGAVIGAIISGLLTYSLKPTGYTKISFSIIRATLKQEKESKSNDTEHSENPYTIPQNSIIASMNNDSQYISCKDLPNHELGCAITIDENNQLIPFHLNKTTKS